AAAKRKHSSARWSNPPCVPLNVRDGPWAPGWRRMLSVEPPQVHPCVHVRDLLRVAIEHQRVAAAELADTAFRGLAPARVIDIGIHVRVEAVLMGRGLHPRGDGLLLHEPDRDDGLDALE